MLSVEWLETNLFSSAQVMFRIPRDLDGELGFPMLISKDAEGHILHEAISVRVLAHPRVTLFCGVYSHGSRGRDRNRHGTWTR